MRGDHFRVEHSQRPTITELQEKILQHALRDLGENYKELETKDLRPTVEQVSKSRSEMSNNIHRWTQLYESEKGL